MLKQNKKWKKAKKAQEEIFGFVLIVLVVMIIGLVFLAFSLRQRTEPVETKEAELSDLLDAVLSYTTDCVINAENQNIRDLIRICKTSFQDCDGDPIEEYLETNLTEILNTLIGKEEIANQFIHGYNLTITQDSRNIIPSIAEGNQTGNYFATDKNIPTGSAGGYKDIIVKLKCYYS